MKIVDATVLFDSNDGMHGIKKVEMKLIEKFIEDPSVKYVNFATPNGATYVSAKEVRRLVFGEPAIVNQGAPSETRIEPEIARKQSAQSFRNYLVGKLRALISVLPRSWVRLGITLPLGVAVYLYRGAKQSVVAVTRSIRDFGSYVKRELDLAFTRQKTATPKVNETPIINSYFNVNPRKVSGKLGVLSDLGPRDTFFSAGLLWKRIDLSLLARAKIEYKFRIISLIYDVIPVKFPHLSYTPHLTQYLKYFSDLIQVSDKIVTYSEANVRDILCFAQSRLFLESINIEKVALGFDDFSEKNENLRPVNQLIDYPFIVYVSTIERRKNHEVLYRAYEKAALSGLADAMPTLVLVGSYGWGAENIINDINRDPVLIDSSGRRLIIFLGNISQEELSWIYKNAHFSVYPSLYEGWGLPVTESLMMGTAVVASEAEALIESGMGLATHLPPKDSDAWLKEILKLSAQSKVEVQPNHKLSTWGEMTNKIVHLMQS